MEEHRNTVIQQCKATTKLKVMSSIQERLQHPLGTEKCKHDASKNLQKSNNLNCFAVQA